MPTPRFALTLFIAALLACPAFAHEREDHDQPSQQPSVTEAKQPDAKRKSPGLGKPPPSPVSAYKTSEILGWKMLVHEDLLADKELWKQVHDEMHHQLFRITRVVPAEQVKLLKEVPVWIELNNPYSNNCQFHPSKKWLEGNGYLPEKAEAVEISNAKGFLRSSERSQPFVMLHELAHAYHHLHLSFDQEDVIAAYKKAKDAGSYDEVLHMNGRKVRAYAMTDHKEYFAEATEAYFGTNDHYPFVRPQLKLHDPTLYALLTELWGVKK